MPATQSPRRYDVLHRGYEPIASGQHNAWRHIRLTDSSHEKATRLLVEQQGGCVTLPSQRKRDRRHLQ